MVSQRIILVVEDNALNREILSSILLSQYQVLEAENGQQALEVLRDRADEISLILLDIDMPVMDGYTFLEKVKADPILSSVPVIVTTQSDGEADEVAALSHGAADFVPKPYRPQIILHRVASIINLRETAAMINQFQYDHLTGLYNKEFFYQRVKDILLQHPEKDYDILCSDIENFKLINDVFGIPEGDRLLCGIAQLYTRLADGRGISSRFNADHFACLLERGSDYSNEMFVQFSAQINALSKSRNVVIKWGVYAVSDRRVPVEQMCDRAFLAARSIKGQYAKHYARYDDALRAKLLREQAITDGMEQALAGGQFVIYLQPKYRIDNDSLAGAEALVRWQHPQWGFQSPAEFIPLFEKNGFITELDMFVWDKACAVLRDWDDKGYAAIPVSVNVSRADVYHADLANILLGILEKYRLPPSRLHLEITESAYTENPDQIISTVSHLRELGFVIEMDDFGSGYSSLNMLNKMPMDILKLDMKFIQSETAKPLDQGILHFIMDLARWMSLSVVAEGVETREQLDRLREIGCDYVQGYYFAKPMPIADFEKLLGRQDPVQPSPAGTDRGKLPQAILVADEDPVYREAVSATFEGMYRVLAAANAQQALTLLTQYKNELAAVVLSLTLPDGGGFYVLDELRCDSAGWPIPVIATAGSDSHLEERALELGADDFAVKPHTQKSLYKRTLRAMGMTAAWKRERALQDEAYRDYLTGLLNRRGLNAAYGALRREDAPIALYLFDLDDLKRINDTLGHAQGDDLLKRFSSVLRAHSRGSDILARFGGDEFVVIMPHMDSPDNALKKGEKICRALRKDCSALDRQVGCTAGVLVCDAPGPLSEMIGHADQALYLAKTGNKGGCCLWRG